EAGNFIAAPLARIGASIIGHRSSRPVLTSDGEGTATINFKAMAPDPSLCAGRRMIVGGNVQLVEQDHWFDGKQFTTDWNSHRFSRWSSLLSPLHDKPVRILEVGSW